MFYLIYRTVYRIPEGFLSHLPHHLPSPSDVILKKAESRKATGSKPRGFRKVSRKVFLSLHMFYLIYPSVYRIPEGFLSHLPHHLPSLSDVIFKKGRAPDGNRKLKATFPEGMLEG